MNHFRCHIGSVLFGVLPPMIFGFGSAPDTEKMGRWSRGGALEREREHPLAPQLHHETWNRR